MWPRHAGAVSVCSDLELALGARAPALTPQRLWPVAVGVVGEGLQHPDLQHAAVPPDVGRRGVQSFEKTERRSDRGGSPGMAAALGVPVLGAVLGEQEPRQGQVLVLAQVVGVPSAMRRRVLIAAMGRMSG